MTNSNLKQDWQIGVGKPSRLGIDLNVILRNPQGNKLAYQIRGLVGIPRPSQNDGERTYCAKFLYDNSAAPRNMDYALVGWEEIANEQYGVAIRTCRRIPCITDSDLHEPPKIYIPPDYEEPGITFSESDYTRWDKEYKENRYCRFEDRKSLHQRLDNIFSNLLILNESGQMTLTSDEIWWRLFQHVLTEMRLRNEPPTPTNRHPQVDTYRPFKDGNVCRKAAEVVAARGTSDEVLVKYGKPEHMKYLYESGSLRINPVSEYKKEKHNQAIRDDERTLIFKGGFKDERNKDSYLTQESAGWTPENIARLRRDFVTLFNAPKLASGEVVEYKREMSTDYWAYCMAIVLDPRLFADFDSTACVIVKRQPFMERLVATMKKEMPSGTLHVGKAEYEDPLGAFSSRHHNVLGLPIHMSKSFEYSYQNEFRFAHVPTLFQENLAPVDLVIGSLADIAEYIEINL